MLKRRFEASLDADIKTKVTEPYTNTAVPLPPTWAEDRRTLLTKSFTLSQLDTAKTAAKAMQGVWQDILSGGTDSGSIISLLTDINAFVDTAQALKDAKDDE